MPEFETKLENQGFCLVPDIAGHAQIERLKIALTDSDLARAKRDGQTYGARNLLRVAEVRAVAADEKVAICIEPLLGQGYRLVRGLFFDKTAKANWPVAWHQDLTLAVQRCQDQAGWTNWTIKRGVVHVQPPAEVLGRMVTMRLHLDDCPAENGPLRVIPGSHRYGVLRRDQIQARPPEAAQVIVARAGDALFMHPLLLHASSPARMPSHRRVLHLEFAPPDLLPEGLCWAET